MTSSADRDDGTEESGGYWLFLTVMLLAILAVTAGMPLIVLAGQWLAGHGMRPW